MKKILLIDDEPSIRAGFRGLLEARGFEVVEAPNGAEGIVQARKHLPDLILCDVNMPELNGHQVLTTLRKEAGTATIPFIFLTGRSDRADLRKGMTLGADDYLTKPCTGPELLEAVNTRLNRQAVLTEVFTAEMKMAEDKIQQLLHYDTVSGLPNQMMLHECMVKSIADTASTNRFVAVLAADMDRFARLYETLSRASCEQLIQAMARRLLECVGNERNTVARLSEDQFIIIVSDIGGRNDAAEAAQMVLQAIAQPFDLRDQKVYLTCSIGISVFPEDGRQPEDLIRKAEAAMHHSKKNGGNQVRFYEPELSVKSADRLLLENGLRAAIERGELQVHYQPQVNLRSGEIVGAEALVRWRHAERGPISPAQFIPIAEESGLIVPLGEAVLRQTCSALKSWQNKIGPSFRVAVNFSAAQFAQETMIDNLHQVLAQAQIQPEHLEIELTESTLMRNPDRAEEALGKLKNAGFHISIDDFGTGYSSLNYLKRFPFDTVKIDQSFVRDIKVESKNAVITSAMIQMAHNLGLNVVAEGVETNAELLFLHLNHCDAMQGYLFSPAIPAVEFESFLTSGKRLDIQGF